MGIEVLKQDWSNLRSPHIFICHLYILKHHSDHLLCSSKKLIIRRCGHIPVKTSQLMWKYVIVRCAQSLTQDWQHKKPPKCVSQTETSVQLQHNLKTAHATMYLQVRGTKRSSCVPAPGTRWGRPSAAHRMSHQLSEHLSPAVLINSEDWMGPCETLDKYR